MNLLKNVKIGADIELFLAQKDNLDNIVSAEGYIKGTKREPFNFDVSNKYFATSLDNVLAEFCIPPVTNVNDFEAYIQKAVNYINQTIPQDLCTVALPAAYLEPQYLQTENAITFGCEPDFNAYTGKANVKPFSKHWNLRSAGGHIHIGYDTADELTNREIIKALDLFVGVPSVIQEPDNERKELYGSAGAYRTKPYGVEYRTISNYYLQSKVLIHWLYQAIMEAINYINSGKVVDDALALLLPKVINNNNKEEAFNLIKTYNLKLAL
jgi:Phage phiEco32-like COOH.NH2 ligase-type 2